MTYWTMNEKNPFFTMIPILLMAKKISVSLDSMIYMCFFLDEAWFIAASSTHVNVAWTLFLPWTYKKLFVGFAVPNFSKFFCTSPQPASIHFEFFDWPVRPQRNHLMQVIPQGQFFHVFLGLLASKDVPSAVLPVMAGWGPGWHPPQGL